MGTVEMARLIPGSPLRGGLLQLRRFRRRRRVRRPSASITAATSSSARGKVLTGNPVVVAVEPVGIARQQVFLRFLLGGEVGAVIVDGRSRTGREQRESGGSGDRK
jgi:hypothetical protein